MIRTGIESLMADIPWRVMFQDEARFGRIDDPSRCWTKSGCRPKAKKQIIREYTYLYGAFCPQNGDMDSFILPYMDTVCMNIFLREISSRHPDELILMVADGAPCHTGNELIVPDNIRLLFLPPYCPQLNPAENMWHEIREKSFGNISFNSMDQLKEHLVVASLLYEKSPQIVKSITNWGWMGLDSV